MAVRKRPGSRARSQAGGGDASDEETFTAVKEDGEAAELAFITRGESAKGPVEITPEMALDPDTRAEASGRVVEIDPAQIVDDGLRDRSLVDEELDELKTSIERHGQTQPIQVTPSQDGHHWRVVAGRRRMKACKALDRKVLALVVLVDDLDDYHAKQLIENKDRRDVSYIEYVLAFGAIDDQKRRTRLMEAAGFSPAQRSHFNRILRDVPSRLLGALSDERISRDTLLELAGLCAKVPPKVRNRAVKQVLQSGAADAIVILRTVKRSLHEAIDGPSKAPAVFGPVTFRGTRKAFTIAISREQAPEFAAFMEAHAHEVLDEFRRRFEGGGK